MSSKLPQIDHKKIDLMLEGYDISSTPPNWNKEPFRFSKSQKLDFIASKILAKNRSGVKSLTAIRDTGYLTQDQMKRRRSREVFIDTLDLSE